MLATERVFEIEEAYGEKVQSLVPLELDGETLRLTEQWHGRTLKRYSYYWLTSTDKLKIGWDNAPHHTRLKNFPHHKHVGRKENLQPSFETCLEEVMKVVLSSEEGG